MRRWLSLWAIVCVVTLAVAGVASAGASRIKADGSWNVTFPLQMGANPFYFSELYFGTGWSGPSVEVAVPAGKSAELTGSVGYSSFTEEFSEESETVSSTTLNIGARLFFGSAQHKMSQNYLYGKVGTTSFRGDDMWNPDSSRTGEAGLGAVVWLSKSFGLRGEFGLNWSSVRWDDEFGSETDAAVQTVARVGATFRFKGFGGGDDM